MERYRVLDVLRGVGILGILPVNITYFAMPFAKGDHRHAGDHALDHLAAHLTSFFFEYRFISLFSLLFGVGMVILRERCEARGDSFRHVIVRRLLALLLFGVLHVVLLWYGDILTMYALVGLAAFWCTRWTARRLYQVGAALVFVPLVFIGLVAALPEVAAYIDEPIPELTATEREEMIAVATGDDTQAFLREFANFHPVFETAVYRDGGFLAQFVVRVTAWILYFFFALFLLTPRVAGLFLIGMACAKSGWLLRPDDHRPTFRRLLTWGFAFGVPIQCVATWIQAQSDIASQLRIVALGLSFIASLGMLAAYVGGIGLVAGRRWTAPFAAVGRTAFSNYILQSVLCTALFYSWGFGLFGTLDRGALLGIVIAIWALQLAVSPLWLSRFGRGPLEYVWRRMTYGAPGRLQ